MGFSWTPSQQKVIDSRNQNVLVSAAAGSGKTAVLVERIISMITDPLHPVDIDRLLVVTFTRAAAGEMKERIGSALEERLLTNPQDENLQRQSSLLHHAQITTIDSFCNSVIRNYFHTISLDPSFRIGEEGELTLIRKEAMEEVLEECYQNKTPEFTHFIECYSSGKSDASVEDLISRFYQFSTSYPWPEEWLSQCIGSYGVASLEEFQNTPLMHSMKDTIWTTIKEIQNWNYNLLEELIGENQELKATSEYLQPFLEDNKFLQKLNPEQSYEELSRLIRSFVFQPLSRKKDLAFSKETKEYAKNVRNLYKGVLQDLSTRFFYGTPEELLGEIQSVYPVIRELVRIVELFSKRFQEKKREQNLLDFSDVEHFALDILVKRENGQSIRTEVAKTYASRLEEILIDEYQDSNFVQEALLTSISKIEDGQNNIFMVGDVKQSIYRFRLARPELFMEKYDTYSISGGECHRIDLHQNFRSRKEVIDSVNDIFYSIMRKELGGITYDQSSALFPGADYPEANGEEAKTELILVEKDRAELIDLVNDYSAKELEAAAIAQRIRELMKTGTVFDRKTGGNRKIQYSDIVILLRSMEGYGDCYAERLMEYGIPAHTGSRTGYFSALEVQTVLNCLKVIDNPRQDIPLAAVLKSSIGNLNGREMAQIKAEFPGAPFWQACQTYAKEGRVEVLKEKMIHFWERTELLRSQVVYLALSDFLLLVLETTGYGDYVAAMPGGEQRKANLDMLVEKAIDFGKTSYRGLFNFMRYMDQLKKYSIDYGEADILGETGNVVRIMTIHKSKGLEYPVVFVGGMGKNFNQMDTRARVVLHPDIGIGTDFVDPDLRLRGTTLIKNYVTNQLRLDMLAEELRILYVALTRAREKLILVGSLEKREKKEANWSLQIQPGEKTLPYSILSKAGSYLDWLLPVMLEHPASIVQNRVSLEHLGEASLQKEALHQVEKEAFFNWDTDRVYDENAREELEQTLSQSYPFADWTDIPSKVSVSELKKEHMVESQDVGELLYPPEELIPFIPDFISKREEKGGAFAGTAYHRVMELWDFGQEEPQSVVSKVHQFVLQGRLTQEQADLIVPGKLEHFLNHSLAKRMEQAARLGNLYKEQPFVIGKPACEINRHDTADQLVLIQGMIDAFFYEENHIVLVDYKTDYVNEERELIEKYQTQLELYSKALEQITEKQVAECWIYSFRLGKAIRVSSKEKSNR